METIKSSTLNRPFLSLKIKLFYPVGILFFIYIYLTPEVWPVEIKTHFHFLFCFTQRPYYSTLLSSILMTECKRTSLPSLPLALFMQWHLITPGQRGSEEVYDRFSLHCNASSQCHGHSRQCHSHCLNSGMCCSCHYNQSSTMCSYPS